MPEEAPGAAIDPPARTRISRRRVLFLHGLDPRGPGPYHALYREQAALQGAVTGQRLQVGGQERIERTVTRWTVDDAEGVRSEIDVLRWDDLIRREWRRNDLRLLWDFVRTYAFLLGIGFIRRIDALSRPYWFTMSYPLAAAGAVLAAPLLLGTGAALAAATRIGPWPAAIVGAAMAAGGLWGLRRIASWIKADWIMQITVFTFRQGRSAVDGLDERIDHFATRIDEALADPGIDEVLVVGHSAGAALAVSAVARSARNQPPERLGRLALLTIGHMIPTVGLNPRAEGFRSELATVAASAAITWADVTAPPDGACFPLTDPVAACGLEATGRPRLAPARFHRQFTPERYRQVLRSRFRIHFQYLMAAELPAGFDYFRTTAGPSPLSALTTD